MLKLATSLVLALCITLGALAADTTIAKKLQDASVTIRSNTGEGSGVVIKRGEQNFVLTAAHVVDGLRHVRSVVDPATGTERKIVEFDDAEVVLNIYEDNRKVGQLEMLAQVINFSDAEFGEDLALLRILKKNFLNASAEFYLGTEPPAVGAELYHVGSLKGQFGSNSVTTGVVSQLGRIHNGKLYDQTSCPAFPGSSGGGVYFKDNGQCIGILVRGGGETFNLIVPVRRVKTWADRLGLAFVLDPNVSVPSDADLKKVPIEDTGRTWPVMRSSNGANGATTQPVGPPAPSSQPADQSKEIPIWRMDFKSSPN